MEAADTAMDGRRDIYETRGRRKAKWPQQRQSYTDQNHTL